jgi:adenosylhomocysteinase
MDGFEAMTMDEASFVGDIFVTVTGCSDVITDRHFKNMKSGAVLSNAGHFDVEVNVAKLKDMADSCYTARNNITAYKIGDKELYVIAEGRLVNLAAADGHPAEIMDLSFAIQALSLKYLLHNKGRLVNKVYDVPKEIDDYVARLKLRAMGINIDSLTDEQRRYMYGGVE